MTIRPLCCALARGVGIDGVVEARPYQCPRHGASVAAVVVAATEGAPRSQLPARSSPGVVAGAGSGRAPGRQDSYALAPRGGIMGFPALADA